MINIVYVFLDGKEKKKYIPAMTSCISHTVIHSPTPSLFLRVIIVDFHLYFLFLELILKTLTSQILAD